MARKGHPLKKQDKEQLMREVSAVLLLVLAVITGLGLSGLTSGTLLDHWIALWRYMLGWGALGVALFLGTLGVGLLQGWVGPPTLWPWRKLISGEVTFLALLTVLHTLTFGADPWLLAEQGDGGGIVGWALSGLLITFIGPLPTAVLALLTVIVAGAWTAGVTREHLRYFLGLVRARLQQAVPDPVASGVLEPASQVSPVARPPQTLKIITGQLCRASSSVSQRPGKRERRLPPLDLLEASPPLDYSEKEVRRKVQIIEKTLGEFGLPVRVTEVRRGPVLTQFGVEPGYVEKTGPDGETWDKKVRISRISALANDMALALAAPSLRIEAPVPGRSVVGIEVPNDELSVVRLRSVLESKAFRKVKSPLAVALGQDIAGRPVVADLTAMPHLLIAGTTGSGKSVSISSMVTCLAFNNPPERLRLVMIDPKLVEMTRFNGLPHLMGRVEVELERIVGVLRWVTIEMDKRYQLLSEEGARHLKDYNRRMQRQGEEILPHIVVFIDELADLMMMAAGQTEQTITRLAQMARAVGIHLVIATQRPSTDVVTGLIKANFPARISFAVASQVDSRVIIDQGGAEHLLGRGDMLFLSPESGHARRVQSCYVSDNEIEALVNYWRQESGTEEQEPAPWEAMLSVDAMLENDRDPLLEDSVALVRESGEASASLLQRRLHVGYPRAAAIIDQMEQLGFIGPPQTGGRTRDVLIEDDEEIAIL